MTLYDELKLWIQDPAVKQTLRDIIVSALLELDRAKARRQAYLYRDANSGGD